MVSNSLNTRELKSLKLETEVRVSNKYMVWSFFQQYLHKNIVPSNHCFLANFQECYMSSSKKIGGILFLNENSK